MMISVTILTKNSEETLHKTLSALKGFDEIILLDTGSVDTTCFIAEQFSNVKVLRSSFIGFGPLHNLAAKHASHDWILSVDSDETVSYPLFEEIQTTALNPKCIYSIPFHNYLNGKHIKWCGWYPDRHVRLYHKKTTHFSDAFVHETILKNGLKEIALTHPIQHYSYRKISDFLKKMEVYSTLFAEQNAGKKKSSFKKALFHSLYAFFKSYVLQKGFLGGREGFLISIYNAQTTFYKYLKLQEMNQKLLCS